MGARFAVRALPWAAAALTAYELYRWYQGEPGGEGWLDPDGAWQLRYACEDRFSTHWIQGIPPNQACLVGQFGGGANDISTPVPSNVNAISIYWNTGINNPSNRFRMQRTYDRVRPGVAAAPHLGTLPSSPPVWELFSPVPWTPGDPLQLPVGRPVAPPRPQPTRRTRRRVGPRGPNPFRAPTEQTQRGPRPQPTRRARDAVEVFPDGGATHPPGHRLQPPTGGTREIKMRMMPQGLQQFLNTFTEGLDAIYCMYRALPLQHKARGYFPTPQEAVELIYNFLGHQWVDVAIGNGRHYRVATAEYMANAIYYCVRAQLMDMIFAAIGRRIGQATHANPFWNSPHGPMAGEWSRQEISFEIDRFWEENGD